MDLMFSTEIKNEDELPTLAKKVLQSIQNSSIILLSGDLSAGKTTLVSCFCKLFDIQTVQSPTYSIHQRYFKKSIVIDHFDLYRLETEEDIESSGFYDLLNSPANYKFIEWPEKISKDNLPLSEPLYKIVIKIVNTNTRQIELYQI